MKVEPHIHVVHKQTNNNQQEFHLSIPQNLNVHDVDMLEYTVYYYPTDQSITADNLSFLPYGEYVQDVANNKRSTYQAMNFRGKELFGVFLGVIIALLFAIFDIAQLLTLESFVSLFGAYIIGKELWNDITSFLHEATKNKRLRWMPPSFYYARQDFGTIQRFWRLARISRDGQSRLLASKLDFVSHSNSKTVELHFSKRDLQYLDPQMRSILTIDVSHVSPRPGFMLGVKVVRVTRHFGIRFNEEYFQAFGVNTIGTVNQAGAWVQNALFMRRTAQIGALKWYASANMRMGERVFTFGA